MKAKEKETGARTRETTPITSFLKQQKNLFNVQQANKTNKGKNKQLDSQSTHRDQLHTQNSQSEDFPSGNLQVTQIETVPNLANPRSYSRSPTHSINDNTENNNPKQEQQTINQDIQAEGITINIGTHNVRGINKVTEQDNLIAEMMDRKIDIMGLSETKLHEKDIHFAFKKNPRYKFFASSSNQNTYSNGVAILIDKDLAKHVSKVDNIEGRIIALHLNFNRCKLYVMQIYLPSFKKDSERFQRIIRQLILKENLVKTKIILMGDFNAAHNPSIDRPFNSKLSNTWRPEAEIFNFLTDWAFTDVQLAWELDITSPTWIGKTSYSRIDYIWVSSNIAINNIHSFINIQANEIVNSDHTLLSLKLFTKGIIETKKKPPIRKKGNRITITPKEATTEHWEDFKDKVEREMEALRVESKNMCTRYPIDKEGNWNGSERERTIALEKLDEFWIKFATCITKAAFKTLPTKKSRRSTSDQQEIILAPEFHQYRKSLRILKVMNEIEHTDNKNEIQRLGKLIQEFNTNKNVTWPITDYSQSQETDEIDWQEWRREIKEATSAFKEVCIRIENKRKLIDIRNTIEQRCLDYKGNQKRMVKSLTSNFQSKVNIDRIMITEESTNEEGNSCQFKYISTEPQEIKCQVEKYYTKAFEKRKSNFDGMSQSWKEQYEPRKYIEEDWFSEVTKEINETEIRETIRNLPNNKAPGPSGITYEMLKKLGNKGLKTLVNIFNACIVVGSIPKSWKQSNIYPIPKKEDWMAELGNTRPIVLMEATRKCFTKIITNRLSLICKEKHILRGPNFAGLPGESTQEPIQLLNNICEEAREQNKELWILLQDTAKAYDTVNLEMLEKALRRIRSPGKLTKLILSLFKNRKFQVIIEDGLTDTVMAGDGIDQGETISPILWRIFYDPLLCKIQEDGKLGYTMKCNWNPNIRMAKEESLVLRSATIAYMDDTTWIANSRQNLQQILDEAREFYAANDSQINSRKSVLLNINSSEELEEDNCVYAGLNREKVTRIKPEESTRFLGVWICSKDPKKDTKQRIQQEINKIRLPLERKKMTDKQALYVLNRVLMPRIEYRTQVCHLSYEECEQLTRQYRGIVKAKAKICGTMPNSVIHHNEIFNLKCIWDLQIEAQITGLVNRLNDKKEAGKSTIIRLKQAQIKNWEPTNLIKGKIPADFDCKRNFSATLIKVANELGIGFINVELEKIFQWSGGTIPIKEGVNNIAVYKKSTAQLKERKLMYIDQLIDSETGTLLSWEIIKGISSGSNKGKAPTWYKSLKVAITEKDGRLKDDWKIKEWTDTKGIDNEFYNKPTEDKRVKEWCCFRDKGVNKDNIYWGKIKEKRYKENVLYHYNCDPEGQSTILKECKDMECEFRENKISKQVSKKGKEKETELTTDRPCIIAVQKRNIWACKYLNKEGNNHRKKMITIPCNIQTLENRIPENWQDQIKKGKHEREKISEVVIEDWDEKIIIELVKTDEYKKELLMKLEENRKGWSQEMLDKRTYEYYTDGSLINGNTGEDIERTRMGAAWIQTKGPEIDQNFGCGVQDWPSSSRAEATAILTALLVTPRGSKVVIATDSMNCITTYKRLSRVDPKLSHKRWLKIKNWSIWSNIIEIVKKKELKVELKKVKAHSGEEYNERADQLAKEANKREAIEWCFQRCKQVQTAITWKNIIVEEAPREFLKRISKIKNNYRWTKQDRNQAAWKKQMEEENEYTWKQFWSHLQAKGLDTSFKESDKRNFRIKVLHDELPTLERLTSRRPDLYNEKNNKCRMCSTELETREHLFRCRSLENLTKQAWESTMAKVQKRVDKLVEKEQEGEGKERIKNLQKEMLVDNLTKTVFEVKENRLRFALGMMRKDWIGNISRIFAGELSVTKMNIVLGKACVNFLEEFRKLTWKERCKETVETDKILGFDLRIKKGKTKRKGYVRRKRGIDCSIGTGDRIENRIENRVETKSDKEIRKERCENESLKIGEVVWGVIKKGMKWLGMT